MEEETLREKLLKGQFLSDLELKTLLIFLIPRFPADWREQMKEWGGTLYTEDKPNRLTDLYGLRISPREAEVRQFIKIVDAVPA